MTNNTRLHRTVRQLANPVAVFRAKHGRWPSQNGATERERALYGLVRTIRKRNKNDKLTAAEKTYLSEALPGWNTPLDRDYEWNRTADLVAAFVRSHGRLPSPHGATEAERTHASWVSRCRTGAATPLSGTRIDGARRKFLDTSAPGWDTPWEVTAELNWRRKVSAIAEFRADTGRWPSGNSVDPAELSLASFRQSLRAKKRGVMNPPLTAAQIMHLNATIPGWTDTRDQDAEWNENARLLGQFRAGRNRWPLDGATDPLERKLARWHSDVRGAASGGKVRMNVTAERRDRLNLVAPGWEAPYRRPSRRAA